MKVGAVLVVGGGIAGMQSSLDLADSGFKVYLVEKDSAIGGIMSRLDKTFPTNDCAMCIVSPKLVATGRHPNISIISYSEVVGVDGEAGNFKVRIRKKPRYINLENCTGCGVCSSFCPLDVPNDYNAELNTESCVAVRYPQAIPKVAAIDKDACLGCGLCFQMCEADAINYEQKEEIIEINVGSIILTLGADIFNPEVKKEYGYGRFPNVVSSIEFERILSASGPFDGHVLRPDDGKTPKKIAWIQCVGSRDFSIGNPYCSSVCCMYAIKEAIIAREHNPDIECQIFYMDIRAFGKGFEKYYVNAEKAGIKFTKTRISKITQKGDFLQLRYEDEKNNFVDDEFDMVVLSSGFECKERHKELSEIFGINLNVFNFCETNTFEPIKSSREGIYVSGTFRSPKDVPDTVAESSAAASGASSLLSTERNTLTVIKEYPPEINVEGLEPRVGVFVCHCGINIGSIVNVPEVIEFAKTLPYVILADHNLYTCSQDTQEKMKELIIEHKLNRIVVSSCTPRTHEPLFQNTIREVGLNSYLFSMANIREHVSWVHRNVPKDATEKAKDLVAMAVAKAVLQEPIADLSVKVIQKAIVIGGGIAGMTAANELSKQGYQTYLLEKSSELGGLSNKIRNLITNENLPSHLESLKKQIESNDKIKLFLNAEIKEIGGSIGNYSATINSNGKTENIEAGAIIIATGGKEYVPTEFNYGNDERILLQLELEEKINNNELKNINNIVMIQCVGSRCEERNYCSRVCCTEALKNAIALKKINPKMNITILNRDIRSYGFKEIYYRDARDLGVKFIKFNNDEKPLLNYDDDKKINISIFDHTFERTIIFKPDLLILSSAIIPNVDENLVEQLKLPLDENKFFLEAHTKLRPIDFSTDGIFLCGLAHSPKFIEESIIQAQGAVSRACTILSEDSIEIEGIKPRINPQICVGCGICVEECPFDALSLQSYGKKKISVINIAKCHGCGICASSCPRGASELIHFNDSEIITQIESLTSR